MNNLHFKKKISALMSAVILCSLFNGIPVLAKEENETDAKSNSSDIVVHMNDAVITFDAKGEWESTEVEDPPYYSQTDPAWGNVQIGNGKAFAHTGCVPTVSAMVLQHFGIDESPLDMGYLMNEWGDYNADYGHGTDTGVWKKVAAHYCLAYMDNLSEDDIRLCLQEGMLVIGAVYMGGGFTHCVLMYGYGSDDHETQLMDPISGSGRWDIHRLFIAGSQEYLDCVNTGPFVAIGTGPLEDEAAKPSISYEAV